MRIDLGLLDLLHLKALRHIRRQMHPAEIPLSRRLFWPAASSRNDVWVKLINMDSPFNPIPASTAAKLSNTTDKTTANLGIQRLPAPEKQIAVF